MVAVVGVMAKKLEYFSGEDDTRLKPWLDRFDAVIEAEGKATKAAAIIRTCLKGDAAEVVRVMPADDRKDLAKIKAELLKQFDRRDKTHIQREFYNRKLEGGESVGKFVRSLRQLAEEGFPGLEPTAQEQIIKSQFLNGIPNDLRSQLSVAFQYKVDDASLKDLEEFTTNWERNGGRGTASVHQVTMPSSKQDSPETIQTVVETALGNLEEKLSEMVEAKVNSVFARQVKYPRSGQRKNQPRNDTDGRCYHCGVIGHFKRDCPQLKSQIVCYRCEKRGHKVSECPDLPSRLRPNF